FLGADSEYPFALAATSPAINAGTLDLPAGIELPEYDLAGNPRIYGDGIDMGAYEYQGEPQAAEEDELIIPQANKISSYPNPFYPQRSARNSSNIHLDLAESGQIEFAIYNIKGQKVKSLLDAYSELGRFELQGDGKDDLGQPLASGTYLIKLAVNQELRQAKKITVLK
ncbi:MAG: choice-of-anchor Q domain-containing protein, partial [Candidatus Cloacimonadales bacterium]